MMKANLGVLMELIWAFQAAFCLNLLPYMSVKRLLRVYVCLPLRSMYSANAGFVVPCTCVLHL